MRYATEFFLPLYSSDASTRKYLKQLSQLQDALGEGNDTKTLQTLLSGIWERVDSPDVHRAIVAVKGSQGISSWRGRRPAEQQMAQVQTHRIVLDLLRSLASDKDRSLLSRIPQRL